METPLYEVPQLKLQAIEDLPSNILYTYPDNKSQQIHFNSRTSYAFHELDSPQQNTIISALKDLGFKTVSSAKNGYSRAIFLTNGDIILSMEHINQQADRCASSSMLQPICKPFRIEDFRFEVLPYVCPMDKTSTSPINSTKELQESAANMGYSPWMDKACNRGLLLTGYQVYLDPDSITTKDEDSIETKREEFWNADLNDPSIDPLVKAQHQHLKELSKQVGYELKYGEWPKCLPITKEKLAEVIYDAVKTHDEQRRPFCEIVREKIAQQPMASR